jgi:hypothetical protein
MVGIQLELVVLDVLLVGRGYGKIVNPVSWDRVFLIEYHTMKRPTLNGLLPNPLFGPRPRLELSLDPPPVVGGGSIVGRLELLVPGEPILADQLVVGLRCVERADSRPDSVVLGTAFDTYDVLAGPGTYESGVYSITLEVPRSLPLQKVSSGVSIWSVYARLFMPWRRDVCAESGVFMIQ